MIGARERSPRAPGDDSGPDTAARTAAPARRPRKRRSRPPAGSRGGRAACRASRASPEKRRGRQLISERPTPGTSKITISRSGMASMNGKHNSRLAPMPLNSSSGRPPRPCWVATRRLTPSTSTNSTWGLLISGGRNVPAPDRPRDARRCPASAAPALRRRHAARYHSLQWSHQLPACSLAPATPGFRRRRARSR